MRENEWVTRITIVGGGPGGYEAALVAAQLGAEVTLIESRGLGGSAVLTDCVPSKALIATAAAMTGASDVDALGLHALAPTLDLAQVNGRILKLAAAQSADVRSSVDRAGIRVIKGRASLNPDRSVLVDGVVISGDVVLLATGARPRVLPGAIPDGDRILTWDQVYSLTELPEDLIVVGSGVTGAEFASAYLALGSRVTLISSRDHVLPGEDRDAAEVIETVFGRHGGVVLSRARANAARRSDEGVVVTLTDGREVSGSHVLMAVGSIPNTDGLGLVEAGITLTDRGFIGVDRVSRTSVAGVYAAGDCTGVLMLASVAAMQGRIAMWHALGDAVSPLALETVSSTVFTAPEIATVGNCDSGAEGISTIILPLATNARAKMEKIEDGFVKLFSSSGVIVGGVICAPRASELIYPITIAVSARLLVDQIAQAFTVYPSLSGSIAEAARRLRVSNA
jgi:pyruvate/2-oxoglutarate dehydrogenase complex dihydrolipoamide dehydrogenase (E3) component